MSTESAIEELLNSAYREIHSHSVTLLTNRRGLIGTGTLVRYKDIYGILTAYHVADLISDDEPLGVVIDRGVHSFYISAGPINRQFIRLGAWSSVEFAEDGPDLEFIRLLDPSLISTIKAKKYFYPLVERPYTIEEDANAVAVWYVAGTPGVNAVLAPEPNSADAATLTSDAMELLIGRAFPLSESARGDFDYMTFSIPKGGDFYPEQPDGESGAYGGVSGGGFWRVSLKKYADGSVQASPPILSGVAYYEADFDRPEARLIGHGPRSVHEVLPRKLDELNSEIVA